MKNLNHTFIVVFAFFGLCLLPFITKAGTLEVVIAKNQNPAQVLKDQFGEVSAEEVQLHFLNNGKVITSDRKVVPGILTLKGDQRTSQWAATKGVAKSTASAEHVPSVAPIIPKLGSVVSRDVFTVHAATSDGIPSLGIMEFMPMFLFFLMILLNIRYMPRLLSGIIWVPAEAKNPVKRRFCPEKLAADRVYVTYIPPNEPERKKQRSRHRGVVRIMDPYKATADDWLDVRCIFFHS